MIKITVDEEEFKRLYLEEINKRLELIEQEVLLMNRKQLCKMLSLSWPTIEKIFISDSSFPYIRIGTRWLFHRKEVEKYIEKWSVKMSRQTIN